MKQALEEWLALPSGLEIHQEENAFLKNSYPNL